MQIDFAPRYILIEFLRRYPELYTKRNILLKNCSRKMFRKDFHGNPVLSFKVLESAPRVLTIILTNRAAKIIIEKALVDFNIVIGHFLSPYKCKSFLANVFSLQFRPVTAPRVLKITTLTSQR